MGARGARGRQAVGAGQEVEQGGTVQVARMVHVAYWVPAGRAMDATADTLRVGATDATEVGSRTPEVRRLGAGDAGRHGFSHRETACSSPQGRTHRVGYTTQKTKARVGEAKGTPNVPSGRRKSPAEAVLVQANIRKVPARVCAVVSTIAWDLQNQERFPPRY